MLCTHLWCIVMQTKKHKAKLDLEAITVAQYCSINAT